MGRKKASVEYKDFTGGFITEKNPLNFPENASIDENNVNINIDGSRQRRFGMDWSTVANVISTTGDLGVSGYGVSSYSWFSAGNDGDQNLGVLQHGRTLYFYNLDREDPSDTLVTSITFSAPNANIFTDFTYTSAFGKLVVATGSQYVQLLSWDGVNLTQEAYRVKVRDIWGIDDGLTTEQRPTTPTPNHLYNLRNQGFPNAMRCVGDEFGGVVSVYTEPVTYTFSKRGWYPSNADLVWASRLGVLSPGSVQTDNIDAYSPWELEKAVYGSTPAPQGRAVIDLFEREKTASAIGRAAALGPLGGAITQDYSTGYISSVSAFAGRIWYTVEETSTVGGDSKTPILSNMILYGQATDDTSRWNACHARNDPSSETFNDILASDGGVISIPEAGKIYKAIPLGESLFVFSSNGVWEVYGGETNFSSSVQSVIKVTDRGVIANKSIVVGDNLIGYWSETGIYSISLEPKTLRGIATNLTESTIQSYYDDIPITLKKEVLGAYDSLGRSVLWLHSTVAKDSPHYFDTELLLNTVKGSFTKRKINAINKTLGHGPYPIATLDLKKIVSGVQQENITTGAGIVTDILGNNVTHTISNAEQKTKSSLMYWLADFDNTTERFRLGGYLDYEFVDYPKIQDSSGAFGADSPAYILTGYLTGGDSSRVKYLPYISVKSKRTESDWLEDGNGNITVLGESSCLLQVQWEWTNNPLAGKWSSIQQVYRLPRFFSLDSTHTFSFDVVNTRNKIRGSGRAASLLFSSEPKKDMYLLGWGIDMELKEKV